MSWFESHRSLKNHRKTKDLAKRLGLTRRDTIGLLNEFWWMCIDYAEDGILKDIRPEDVAAECEWNGDPVKLLESLWQSGFLDPIGNVTAVANGNVTASFIVHDWVERHFCFDLLRQEIEMRRAKVRARVQKYRAKRNVTAAEQVTLQKLQEKESSKEKEVKDSNDVKDSVSSDVDVLPGVIHHSSRHAHVTAVRTHAREKGDGEYKIPEPKDEPVDALVMRFKVLKGVPYEHLEWDFKWKEYYRPFAERLLKDCGTYQTAYACLEHFAGIFIAKGFKDWSLRAVADRAIEWAAAEGGKQHGTANSERFFEALRKQRAVGKDDPGLRATSDAGAVLGAIRDHATAASGNNRGDKTKPTNGHGRTLGSVSDAPMERAPDRGEKS